MKDSQAPYCLVYLSQATREFSDTELEELLAVSRRNNAIQGITGLLLYEARTFMQALEGPLPVVTALFQRISRDSRHREARVICEDYVRHRCFGQWKMAFQRGATSGLAPVEGFSTLLENYRRGTLTALDSRLVFPMLVMFKERLPIEGLEDIAPDPYPPLT